MNQRELDQFPLLRGDNMTEWNNRNQDPHKDAVLLMIKDALMLEDYLRAAELARLVNEPELCIEAMTELAKRGGEFTFSQDKAGVEYYEWARKKLHGKTRAAMEWLSGFEVDNRKSRG